MYVASKLLYVLKPYTFFCCYEYTIVHLYLYVHRIFIFIPSH